jgi:hypothetical protein
MHLTLRVVSCQRRHLQQHARLSIRISALSSPKGITQNSYVNGLGVVFIGRVDGEQAMQLRRVQFGTHIGPRCRIQQRRPTHIPFHSLVPLQEKTHTQRTHLFITSTSAAFAQFFFKIKIRLHSKKGSMCRMYLQNWSQLRSKQNQNVFVVQTANRLLTAERVCAAEPIATVPTCAFSSFVVNRSIEQSIKYHKSRRAEGGGAAQRTWRALPHEQRSRRSKSALSRRTPISSNTVPKNCATIGGGSLCVSVTAVYQPPNTYASPAPRINHDASR